jgi:ubiquinone/menaquinone biosynthesis C-methylase UbiE
MIEFSEQPFNIQQLGKKTVFVFNDGGNNRHDQTVASFGQEWLKFGTFTEDEIENAGNQYFDIARQILNPNMNVLDVGCGSGRWSLYVAPYVKQVEAIDPSDAVYSAAQLTADCENIRISRASVDHIPFPDHSFDLVFSLGVLHHIPDTLAAMKNCVSKVKSGGWFLVYLYYNLDNRGALYKLLFKLSNVVRNVISRLPATAKSVVCEIIAYTVYWPLVTLSRIIKKIFPSKKWYLKFPLGYYHDKSMHIIRNDAFDRFATPLEQRFSKKQIHSMMTACGLTNIVFSDHEPFHHALGQKL